MVQNELRKILCEKLNTYLRNAENNYNVSQVIETIVFIVENYFDIDYKKFVDSLDYFICNKNENQDVDYSNYLNRVDISKLNNFSVKGFLSKGSPMLFFYLGDDDNPCIKVKTSFDGKQDVYNIEVSNNPQVLAKYKKGETKFNNAYVVDYEFVYGLKLFEKSKNIFAETKTEEDIKSLNVTDFKEISNEHKNFLVLLNNAINSKYFNASNISNYGLNILLNSFYDELKGVCLDEYNFSLENIVYLINATLYKNCGELTKPESVFLDFIEDVSYETDDVIQNKKVKLKIPVCERLVEYDVIKSEKYLSIDVTEQLRKKCGVMIISTGDGFSVCMSNRKNKNNNTQKPSFVLNFSENQIRVISIEEKNSSGENQSFEAVVSFENGFIKLNFSSADAQKIKDYKIPLISEYGA